MKHLFASFFALLMVATLGAQTVDQAIAHNDKLVMDQKKILILEGHLVTAFVNGSGSDTIDIEFEIYNDYLAFMKSKYTDIKKFDKEDVFRVAMVELVGTFIAVAQTEYKELTELFAIPSDELTDEHYKRWDVLVEQIDVKENKANEAFLAAQKKFAATYGFSLGD